MVTQMENNPMVSVIIPCYNAVTTISKTLDSLYGQTFRDFEIVVVNDGSTDDSASIIEPYVKKFNGILNLINQTNQGQTVAKNVGIKNTMGQLIAFLDSDDIWRPEKLESQVALMQSNPDMGLYYTNAYKINENGDRIGTITALPSYRGKCFSEILLRNNIVASSVMIRREMIDQVGFFDESLEACENWDLWIRTTKVAPIDFIDRPLTLYRVHSGNMSKNLDKMYRSRLKLIDKHLPYQNNNPKLLDQRKNALFFTHISFAKTHIENLELKEARHELLQAAKIRPNEIMCYQLYLKSLLGKRVFKFIKRIKGHTPESSLSLS